MRGRDAEEEQSDPETASAEESNTAAMIAKAIKSQAELMEFISESFNPKSLHRC